MLKVAIAASGAGHVRRGIEVWASQLKQALAGACQPHLFKGAGSPEPEETPLPCLRRDSRLWGGLASPIPWTLRMYLERLSFAPGLIRRLRPFDILHTADPFLAAISVYARRLGWWRGKTVLSYQGPGPIWKLYANRVGHVQFLAPSYLEGPARLVRNPSDVSVIPNFVDTERFCPGSRRAAREKFKLSFSDRIVLSVGAFTGMKGIPLLARGVARLRPEIPSLRLVLAGQAQSDSGPILAEAARELGEALTVFENVPHGEIPELYRAADCFALGSRFEPFGIAFVEAMASGLPVLGNEVEPTRWIVGDAGVVVNITDPVAVAGGLRTILSDPELSRRALTRARENFSREAVIPLFLALYRSLASPA